MQLKKQHQKEKQQQNPKRFSFSEYQTWKKCPWKHRLQYIQKHPTKKTIYLITGSSLHKCCEDIFQNIEPNFEESLLKESEQYSEIDLTDKDNIKIIDQCKPIPNDIKQAFDEYFGEYEVASIEYFLYYPFEQFKKFEINFKGYIDLILYTPHDGMFHIIDHKTCSWGWDAEKRNDIVTNEQLRLYKIFFSLQEGIDFDKINTYFSLMKRIGKKDKSRIEIFKTDVTKRKVNNTLKNTLSFLNTIYTLPFAIKTGNCKWCDFKNTDLCKR